MKRKTKVKATVDFFIKKNLYSENIPNSETLNVFMETDKGKNLKTYKNPDELMKKFGI